MNYDLPKPIREALARKMARDVHPSADVLTAFTERILSQDERQRVMEHLAGCTECREVVFLAGSAVEEPVGEEQELVVAAAGRRLSPAVLAKPMAAQAIARAASVAAPRRRGWKMWWMWVPAVAVVLVVAGVVVEKRSVFAPGKVTVASRGAPPVATPSEEAPAATTSLELEAPAVAPSRTAARRKPPAKSARGQTNEARNAETLTAGKMAGNVPGEPPSPPAAVVTPQPASPSSQLEAVLGAAQSAPAPAPAHNAFVEGEDQIKTSLMAQPQVAMRAVSGPGSRWRISSDGHLERSTTAGSWTPMLANQPIVFHVVSVVGINVWAGGSGGALFHSSDSGQTWSKQPLAAERSTIVSIHFSDATHGVVTTDGGTRWNTSDGGVTWLKE